MGLYLCFHLGTHFLLFKCHHNSREHEIHSLSKGARGLIWNKLKDVLPTEAITGHIFIFALTPILNMVWSPRSSRGGSGHSLKASVPPDKSHSALFVTASQDAHGQPWLVTSEVLHIFTCPDSGWILRPQPTTSASPAHTSVTTTYYVMDYSFPAAIWRGRLPPGQHCTVSSSRGRRIKWNSQNIEGYNQKT